MERPIQPVRLTLSRQQRISHPETLFALRNEGKRWYFNPLKVVVKDNQQTHPRLGIVVPKRRVKRAVDRNAIRRWIRESFRRQQAQLGAVDVLVSVNASIANKEGEATQKTLKRVLDEAWTRLRRLSSTAAT